jgi:hypothetical protein
MSIYNATVPQYAKILRQLDTWLVKATEHAATLDFDPNQFVACRLAPNQFHLARQIRHRQVRRVPLDRWYSAKP